MDTRQEDAGRADENREGISQIGVRQVDTREYVSVLRDIAEEGKIVPMLIAGSSMSPFLCHNRDYIYFTRPERELRRGDMVFYQRDSGQYVMHRIYKVKPEGYYMTRSLP